MVVSYAWSLASIVLVWLSMDSILDFYTNDINVKNEIITAWPIFLAFIFFDCIQGVASGNIAGLGLSNEVKYVTFINYWLIGIPLSYFLVFKKDLGLLGLWCGPTIACLLNYLIYQYEMRIADWSMIATNFEKSIRKDAKHIKKN